MSLTALALEFDVSVDTIRRDIQALEEQGVVRRVRGGALPVLAPAAPMTRRIGTQTALAERLAAAVRPLVKDGMVVMFDGGMSVLALARLLPSMPGSLVVTPAPAVAMATHCNNLISEYTERWTRS